MKTTSPFRPARRSIVYLGWQGNDNFGDELLYDTWKAALSSSLNDEAPLTLRRYLVTEAASFLRQRARTLGDERIVLLGGGTTVGFDAWADHAELALRMYGARALVAAGAGAARHDDPVTATRQPQDWRRWSQLEAFALWGVRGPSTQDECARAGLSAPVVGDPALLYPVVRPLESRLAAPAIGLCLGSEGTSAYSVPQIVDAINRYAWTRDCEVVLFELTPADRPVTIAARRRLGNRARVVAFEGDVDAMMGEIAACAAFVSERLHGTVAAAAVGVPVVPLSYGSKCDDFWLSITGEMPRLSPTSRTSDVMAEVRRCVEPAFTGRVARAVEAAQRSLLECSRTLDAWQRGERDTASLFGFRPEAVMCDA
ncbi:polysaccharide pyruvyl transferase [Leifsonia sp. LS1]|uniref:polysaccharide pyruvyl transferase family protein n=1 Tax=Leifsonia sp. LS1 TaxID=2828483 RepID=UPI001CFDD4AF|nr:polysaccharide pyruvyl transferase family protein [Leifsonia sp. LS1]GIT80782.1 polysaccharide pyruvyl transferase [Leifsonia sp. LS1]